MMSLHHAGNFGTQETLLDIEYHKLKHSGALLLRPNHHETHDGFRPRPRQQDPILGLEDEELSKKLRTNWLDELQRKNIETWDKFKQIKSKYNVITGRPMSAFNNAFPDDFSGLDSEQPSKCSEFKIQEMSKTPHMVSVKVNHKKGFKNKQNYDGIYHNKVAHHRCLWCQTEPDVNGERIKQLDISVQSLDAFKTSDENVPELQTCDLDETLLEIKEILQNNKLENGNGIIDKKVMECKENKLDTTSFSKKTRPESQSKSKAPKRGQQKYFDMSLTSVMIKELLQNQKIGCDREDFDIDDVVDKIRHILNRSDGEKPKTYYKSNNDGSICYEGNILKSNKNFCQKLSFEETSADKKHFRSMHSNDSKYEYEVNSFSCDTSDQEEIKTMPSLTLNDLFKFQEGKATTTLNNLNLFIEQLRVKIKNIIRSFAGPSTVKRELRNFLQSRDFAASTQEHADGIYDIISELIEDLIVLKIQRNYELHRRLEREAEVGQLRDQLIACRMENIARFQRRF